MKEASYNEPNCYYFFLVSKTSALFVKNFCFVFFIFSSKYKNINKLYINTKVYSLKHKTSFHIYVTSNHFFRRKTKKYHLKHINKQSRNFFLYILIYSLALTISSSLHLFISSSYNFYFFFKKKFTCSFILLLYLFIYLHTFFSSELKCLLQASPS
jgi:hypothetical protein